MIIVLNVDPIHDTVLEGMLALCRFTDAETPRPLVMLTCR